MIDRVVVTTDAPRRTSVHLSVIIPTLTRLETARLLAERVKNLFPSLSVEAIVVSPVAVEPDSANGFIHYVADAGRGVYSAYNAGLRVAHGDYIWFLGDDDYPLDAASTLDVELFDGVIDLLISPVLFSSGRLYRPSRTRLFLHFLNWCQQGVIYRRRQLMRHRFFRRLTVQADQYVNILLRSDPTVTMKYLAQPICVFAVNGVSGRLRDEAYRSLRIALARRTLGCAGYIAFRALIVVEPLIKNLMKIR